MLSLSRRTTLGALGAAAALPFLPARGEATGALNFLAVGDWGRGGAFHQKEVAMRMGETASATHARFIVSVGDNFYEDGVAGIDDPAWVNSYERVYDAPALQVPWYVALGNHDAESPGVRAPLAARYGVSPEACYYALDLAGLRFIFLDVAHWTSASGDTSPYLDPELHDRGQIRGMGPDADQLAWLERELQAADRPVALVSHTPLGYRAAYPMPTLPYGTPAEKRETSVVDVMGDVLQRQTVRAMLRSCPRVKVAFSGHWHVSDMVVEDGIAFCQTASLREYPFEFRVVDVAETTLRVSTLGLSGAFQRQSYIEAWGSSWIAGTPDNRSFEVQLD